MSDRLERIGANEAVFRVVNEEIEKLQRGQAEVSDRTLHLMCECGYPECREQIVVDVDIYERVRADPTRFIVVPGHQIPPVETAIETHDGFLVIEKDEGKPEEIAEATDPRR